MIKICKDKREIDMYKKYSSLKCGNNDIPILLLDRTLFLKAREIFARGYVLIEVRDIKGKTLFYLKLLRDMLDEVFKGTIMETNINYEGCGLQAEKNLDTTLLEKAECFVFEELEEYTFELTEFIRNRYPCTQIFYLDKNAEFFWKENERILILNSIYEINAFWQGRYMYIYSDVTRHGHIIPEGVSLIYNSENIMNSLCWARKVEHLGTKNSGKTILLIDMDFGKGCGLAYIIRTTLCFVCMAFERGWMPVVNLVGDNMYIDSPQNNMWEQYFEPLSHISVRDVMESQNVISVKNNHLTPVIIHINPYFREIWHRTQKHPKINFKSEIMQYFVKFMPKEIQDKQVRVLGAFIRGTDAKAAVSEKEAFSVALECKEIMENAGFDKVFLATEDIVYFEAFKSVFEDKLLHIVQKRVMSCKDQRKPIGELLDIKTGEKNHFGLIYLMITYCLSRCNALVYNIPSGGYYLANKWCENPYEFSYCLEGNRTEIESIVKCLEMVAENALTAIYGTGHIGKRLLDIIKQRKELACCIIFCDKKAENAEYSFDGYRVIAPSLLLDQYKNGNIQGIIVASSIYAEEIYHSLIANGVSMEHVLIVRNQNGVI